MTRSSRAIGGPIGRHPRLAAGGAAILAGLVYLNALHNPFVYDDYHTVVANRSIQNVSDVRAMVLHDPARPIVNVSYAVDRALYGPQPLGFHTTNVLLHMLNVVLLFLLARRLAADRERADADGPPAGDRADLVAFTAAVLFAVHPMMTEAVGYISGRSELLCASFFLAALMSGRRWLHGDGARWAIVTVGLWAAALGAKESAAMFPFVFLVYDRFAVPGNARERRRRLLAVHVPLMAAAILAGLVRLAVFARIEYPGQAKIHWSYVLLELDVIRRYIGLLLHPADQAIFHDVTAVGGLFDPRAWMAIGVLGLVMALVWRLRQREWLVSFGALWFLLLLVPSCVLIVLDQGEPMTEHRVYLASCGWFLAAGAAAGWLAERAARTSLRGPAWVVAALMVVVLSWGAETMVRNVVWADPVTLWRESVDLAPNHFRPRLLLGEALQDAGRRDEAVDEYRTAIRLRPAEQTGYAKLGQCLAEMGRLEDAAGVFTRLALDPRSAPASNGLGAVAMLSGRPDRARQYFLDTIAMDPSNVPARQSLVALDETALANPAEAVTLCEEIQRLAPGIAGAGDCIRRNRARLATGVTPR